jgi:hypothetical protein
VKGGKSLAGVFILGLTLQALATFVHCTKAPETPKTQAPRDGKKQITIRPTEPHSTKYRTGSGIQC